MSLLERDILADVKNGQYLQNGLPPFASLWRQLPQFSGPHDCHQALTRGHGRVRGKAHPWPRAVSVSATAGRMGIGLLFVFFWNYKLGNLFVPTDISSFEH